MAMLVYGKLLGGVPAKGAVQDGLLLYPCGFFQKAVNVKTVSWLCPHQRCKKCYFYYLRGAGVKADVTSPGCHRSRLVF